MKKITGTINFEITIKEDGIETNYNVSQDNELGALAISELILQDTANYYTQLKNTTTGKDKASKEKLKLFTNQANILKKGRTAVARILNQLISGYDDYQNHLIETENKKEEILASLLQQLKDKGITSESGTLTEQEAKELLGDKFKDLSIKPNTVKDEFKELNEGN